MEFLFPSVCILCGKSVTKQEHGLCGKCRDCAETVADRQIPNTDRVICAGKYSGRFREALIHMKFRDDGTAVILPVAELMAQAWEQQQLPKPDVITCVPVSALREHLRGFNQSEELAKHLAQRWELPLERTMFRKVLSRRQSGLKAAKRRSNAERSFFLRKNIHIQGKHVLLVDDIVTTGATVERCAFLLKTAGARTVSVLAAAKA